MNPVALVHEIINQQIKSPEQVRKEQQEQETAKIREENLYQIWLKHACGQKMLNNLRELREKSREKLMVASFDVFQSNETVRLMAVELNAIEKIINLIENYDS